MNNIKREIVERMNSFINTNNCKPTIIHLTLEKENELILLENFPLDKSPREVFTNSLFGLKPNWDSKEFKVE